MLHLTKTWELGNTIYFECLFRNINGELIDPDSTSTVWVVEDAKGTEIDSGGLMKRKEGIWYCFFTPATVGDYLLVFTATIEGSPVVIRKLFKVIETRIK